MHAPQRSLHLLRPPPPTMEMAALNLVTILTGSSSNWSSTAQAQQLEQHCTASKGCRGYGTQGPTYITTPGSPPGRVNMHMHTHHNNNERDVEFNNYNKGSVVVVVYC
eukprot:GHRQ01033887.1.p1 GENE.GHRQ01033887.1~~GHRQ01033887.1.p1  ORF type:complete len:108 (-),score=11.74 GHRQ01033887.1:729-1052(-)